jgi:hypothetical protein
VSYLITLSVTRTAGPRAPRSEPIRRARELFQQFHCFPPQRLIRLPQERTIPKVLMHVGELRGLIYRSDRGQRGQPRTFVHFFQNPPLLASHPAGHQLYILGGNYRVTPRGIEG